jgi:hypothetical protein
MLGLLFKSDIGGSIFLHNIREFTLDFSMAILMVTTMRSSNPTITELNNCVFWDVTPCPSCKN